MAAALIVFGLIAFAVIACRRFDYGLFLFFLLLPSYLIRFHIGPLPTTFLESMLWILIVVWIITVIREGRFPVYRLQFKTVVKDNRLLALGTLFFLVAATIAIFVSVDLYAAAGEWKAFYVEPLLLFIVLVLSISPPSPPISKVGIKEGLVLRPKSACLPARQEVRSLLFALILSGLAVSILSIFQHFTGWMVPDAFWKSHRVTAWYGFPNGVGLFLAPLVPLAIYLFSHHFLRWKTDGYQLSAISYQLLVSLLFLITAPVAILAAKSTGALVGIVGGVGVLLLCWKKTRWPTLAVGVIGLIVILAMPANPIKTELLARDRSGQIRRAIWHETTVFLEDHTLLGAGLASYSERIAPYHGKVNGEPIEIFHHPHNLFLTMWVNLGLLGVAGFVMIVAGFFKSVDSRQSTVDDTESNSNFMIHPYLIATMTTILITGLVDSPYIKNDLSIFFWFVLAVAVLQVHNDQRIVTAEED